MFTFCMCLCIFIDRHMVFFNQTDYFNHYLFVGFLSLILFFITKNASLCYIFKSYTTMNFRSKLMSLHKLSIPIEKLLNFPRFSQCSPAAAGQVRPCLMTSKRIFPRRATLGAVRLVVDKLLPIRRLEHNPALSGKWSQDDKTVTFSNNQVKNTLMWVIFHSNFASMPIGTNMLALTGQRKWLNIPLSKILKILL